MGKNTIEELLELLEPQIKWLSSCIKIKGYEKEDLEQELRLLIIKEFKKGQRLGIEGWFLRLKWHTIYIYRREMREPLTKSITIETIIEKLEEYKNKRRAGLKKKRANYKGFCLHLEEYDKLGIGYSLNDMRRLARKYHCPIPKEYRQKGDK